MPDNEKAIIEVGAKITELYTNVDFGNGGGLEMTANASLRHEDYIRYDDALLQEARTRLNLVEDFRAAGLVRDVGFGTIVSRVERGEDMDGANVSLNGAVRAERERLDYDEISFTIPVVKKEWQLNRRHQLAAAQSGHPLDTESVEKATRAVSVELEKHIISGWSDFDVKGLTNHASRNTFTMSGTNGWAGRQNILQDVESMLTALRNDKFYGPYRLYVSGDVWGVLQSDYSTSKGDRTYIERIEAYQEIEAVRPAFNLSANSAVLLQMTSDVVDLVVGQDITNIEWNNHPMVTDFMVYAAMSIRIKPDKAGNCGIVHASN